MKQEFLDHKLVATKSSKVKFTDSTNHALNFREVVWFSYGKSNEYDNETSQLSLVCHPEEIWCRYIYSTMEPWKKIKPLKRGAFVVEPQRLYHSRLPIKKAKYNDLVASFPGPRPAFRRLQYGKAGEGLVHFLT